MKNSRVVAGFTRGRRASFRRGSTRSRASGRRGRREPSATLAARRAAVMMPAVAALDRLVRETLNSPGAVSSPRTRARSPRDTARVYSPPWTPSPPSRTSRGVARRQIRDGARREGRAPTTPSAPSRFEPGARGSQEARPPRGCPGASRTRRRGRVRRIDDVLVASSPTRWRRYPPRRAPNASRWWATTGRSASFCSRATKICDWTNASCRRFARRTTRSRRTTRADRDVYPRERTPSRRWRVAGV